MEPPIPQPSWRQHAHVAPVRPPVVVELDNAFQQSPCLLQAFGAFHPVEPFLLDDAVHALGYGVVRGLVVLGHADAGVDGLQALHVLVAAVLHAPVGMVDQPLETHVSHLADAHVQGGHRVVGGQAVRKHPADDLVRVGIGQQMQVSHPGIGLDVRDVGHPKLVGGGDFHALGQVLELAVMVVGVGCVATPPGLEHQVAVVQQAIKPVPAAHPARVSLLEHEKELVRPYPRGLRADALHGADYLRAGRFPLGALRLADAIITLAALAKQSAQQPDGRTGMPEPKIVYCLAPAFFSKSTPYSSRPILSTSPRASLRNSE